MPSFTVQKLIDRAKAAADMHDEFVTTTQWIDWLNVERMRLEHEILRHGYLLREGREDIVADGSQQYEISDPLAIIAVYEFDSSGRYRRLRPSDLVDGAGRRDYYGNGDAREYRVFQNTGGEVSIQFYPIPTSGTYQVYIVDQPAQLTSVADTVNYPMGWEEYLVCALARRALAKEETVNPALERQMNEVLRHIEEAAWSRQLAAHQAVRNVDKVERGWVSHPEIPSHDRWIIL